MAIESSLDPDSIRRIQVGYTKFAGRAAQAHAAIEPHLENLASTLLPKLGYRTIAMTRERGKEFGRAFNKVKQLFEQDAAFPVDDAFSAVTDIAGARVIVQYPSHTFEADDALCAIAAQGSGLRSRPDLDNNIEKPKEPSGFRGLKRVFDIELSPDAWFPIEVQYLTVHQFHWAEMEHRVYERPERFPVAVRQELRHLSDALNELSVRADALRWAIEFHHQRSDPRRQESPQ